MTDDATKPGDGTNQGDPGAGEGDQNVNDQSGKTDDGNTGVDKDSLLTKDLSFDKDKSDDENKADDKVGKDKGETQAPEKYEAFDIPDGFDLDEKALELFTPVAKELGLSQAKAQALVSMFGQIQKQNMDTLQARFDTEHKENIEAAKKDDEIGGVNFEKNIKSAMGVINRFGSPGVAKALVESGLGDNLDIIRMFHRIGKSIGEDSLVNNDDGSPKENPSTKTVGQILYDKM